MSIAEAAIPTPYIHSSQKRRKNIWFSQKDGNWSDPNTWISNALSYCQFNFNYPGVAVPAPIFPNVGDDVYINHTVTLDVGTSTSPIVINNLYISGTFKAGATQRYISVNGDLQCAGAVDFTSSNVNVNLYGVNNFINSFTAGTSTINYARLGDQSIMNLSYQNLKISGSNTKSLISDMTILGNLILSGNGALPTTILVPTIECSIYNLTVNGTTTFGFRTGFSKNGSGSLIFIGKVQCDNLGGGQVFNLSGNPTVETRGGLDMGVYPWTTWNSGTGTWTISTNSQTYAALTFTGIFQGDVIISGAITVTMTSVSGAVGFVGWQINTTINGTVSGSSLILQTGLLFNSSSSSMTTGTIDYTTSNSALIGYMFNGDFTLPATSYSNLWVSGTGTKTLGGDTTLSNQFFLGRNVSGSSVASIFECSTFNLTVTGISNIWGVSTFSKTGAGSLLFIGKFAMDVSPGPSTISWSGNPSVEYRGGIGYAPFNHSINTGTGTWTFTTNNQSWSNGYSSLSAIAANIVISGAITLTLSLNGVGTMTFTGTINGNNASSVLDNRTTVNYQNATAPMVTGKLYCNQASNTWLYNMAGNQDIQVLSDPVSPGYYNLTLSVSGAKKLLGNVSVKHTYSLVAPATLNSNGFILSNP